MSSHRWIPRAAGLPISASTSLRGSGPSASFAASVRAAAAIACSPGSFFQARSHSARRASRTATANGHQSRGETRWIVTRISVPWTTSRCSSAVVSAAGSKPRSRDHRPKYIDGAYWAWIPHSRSSASGSGSGGALEQQLPGQQRAVELPPGERAHGR